MKKLKKLYYIFLFQIILVAFSTIYAASVSFSPKIATTDQKNGKVLFTVVDANKIESVSVDQKSGSKWKSVKLNINKKSETNWTFNINSTNTSKRQYKIIVKDKAGTSSIETFYLNYNKNKKTTTRNRAPRVLITSNNISADGKYCEGKTSFEVNDDSGISSITVKVGSATKKVNINYSKDKTSATFNLTVGAGKKVVYTITTKDTKSNIRTEKITLQGKSNESTVQTNQSTSGSQITTTQKYVAPKISKIPERVILSGSKVQYIVSNINSIDKKNIAIYINGKVNTKASVEVSKVENNQAQITVDLPKKLGIVQIQFKKNALVDMNGKKYEKAINSKKIYMVELNCDTTNSNYVNFVTGVYNSFYIKDYKYEVIDKATNVAVATSNTLTTNEYSCSTPLTLGKTYIVKCTVNFYTNGKKSDSTAQGTVQKEITINENKNNDKVEIHFLDVSTTEKHGADTIFIKTPNGKTILIDSADYESSTQKTRTSHAKYIDNYLVKKGLVTPKNGVVTIDYFISTHPDRDHIGGFQELTGAIYNKSVSKKYKIDKSKVKSANRYVFKKVVMGINYNTIYNGTTRRLAVKYYARDDRLITVIAGNCLNIDGVLFNIFLPYPKTDVKLEWLAEKEKGSSAIRTVPKSDSGQEYSTSRDNNQSIVLKLIYANKKVLLTGDNEFYGEELLLGNALNTKNNIKISSKSEISLSQDIMKAERLSLNEVENKYRISRLTKKDISATIMKKGHHGINNSTSLEFLNAVKPRDLVITTKNAKGNGLGSNDDNAAATRITKYKKSNGLKIYNIKRQGNLKYVLKGDGTESVKLQ